MRDAGRFVESQPFCLMKASFNLLVNLVQILLHLLSNCFQKSKRIADLVILILKKYLCMN